MLGKAIFSHTRAAVGRFFSATEGNIAVLFTLAAVPIISFVGVAVDYSRANNARSSMQSALDSAVLMVSKDLTSGAITTSQIGTQAQAYFTALYTNPDAKSVTVTASYTAASGANGSTVQINGSGSINTDFMKLMGFPSMQFNASSTSTWGANLLRVALVLDNTGSMQNYNKIGNLQTAATNLVTQLSALSQNAGDVYISVVPFEVDVNVGTSNVAATWLRWDLWDPKNYASSYTPYNTYCSGSNVGDYWLTMAQCLGHASSLGEGTGYTWNHTPNTSNKSQWNGCVSDRDKLDKTTTGPGYDVDATPPTSTTTNFPADQDQSCPAATILPLTYNWTNVKNTINSMTPGGATNQTIGLQWGWLSLLQQAPLNAPAENPNSTYQHIIVLFTDGLNTRNRWYGDGSTTDTRVDDRMKTLCTKIKSTGVTIYTVQIDTDGAGQSAVLPACASDSGKFFMLTQPSQIASAFQAIGTSISKLRVAR